MGVINRLPKGLLGLLDSKTGGKTPADTDPRLQQVLDLTANYLADIPFEIAQNSQNTTLATGQNYAEIVVPDFSLWYVYQIESRIVSGDTGQGLDTFTVMTGPSGTVPIMLGDNQPDFNTISAVIGQNRPRGVKYNPPLLCSAGTTFATQVPLQTAGARNAITSVLYKQVLV